MPLLDLAAPNEVELVPHELAHWSEWMLVRPFDDYDAISIK